MTDSRSYEGRREHRPLVQAELLLAVILERADGRIEATEAEIQRANPRTIETWWEPESGRLIAVLKGKST